MIYKRTEHTDTFKFGFNFEPRRETEYAMTFDASEELLAGFDISKNIIVLDFNFNELKNLIIINIILLRFLYLKNSNLITKQFEKDLRQYYFYQLLYQLLILCTFYFLVEF